VGCENRIFSRRPVASYAVDEADATTMIATYDLGGGATVFVASHDKANTADDMNTVGINFSF